MKRDSCGSKNFERGENNLSAPSSFIANVLNEMYAFYTEKSGFLKKISACRGRASDSLATYGAIEICFD